MIKIYIPNNNIFERKYIIDIIFGEFLGLNYYIEVRNIKNWEIELKNKKKLIILDGFFSKYSKNLEYLNKKNIPEKVKYSTNIFIVEKDIPIIYGNNILETQVNKVICGIDIFASSFFMLTRWEEYVLKVRDIHDRFPASQSLAFKNQFLNRPIVNEYVEMLWNILEFLGLKEKRKIRKFQIIPTHDVDMHLRYPNLLYGLKNIAGDLLKRKDVNSFKQNLLEKIKVHLKLEQDPFNTFDYLMDLSEEIGVKSYFFFMAKGISIFDNYYKSNDKFIISLINKIKKRDHFIGIHPSYNSYKDLEQFKKEKEELEKIFEIKINYGRQHYLRFEIPITWQIWEDTKMKWESTMCYPEKEGFRCGVCYPFSVFNILTRKKLNLKEKPFMFMDGSFIYYQQNLSKKQIELNIFDLLNKVKKYKGEFILLWHNSSFNTNLWKMYQDLYPKILKHTKGLED